MCLCVPTKTTCWPDWWRRINCWRKSRKGSTPTWNRSNCSSQGRLANIHYGIYNISEVHYSKFSSCCGCCIKSVLFQAFSVLHSLRASSMKQALLKSDVGDCVLLGVFGKKLMQENYWSEKSRCYRNMKRKKTRFWAGKIKSLLFLTKTY